MNFDRKKIFELNSNKLLKFYKLININSDYK